MFDWIGDAIDWIGDGISSLWANTIGGATEATIKIMEVEKVVKDYADNDPEVRITENRLYFKDGLFGEAWLPILKDVEPSTIEKEHLYLDENGIKIGMRVIKGK